MTFRSIAACSVGFLLALPASAEPPTPAAEAPAPPLGWNSFDSYGCYLNEDAAMANLEAMADKLRPHGYEYFVIDNGWFGEYELGPGTNIPLHKHADDVRLNEFGQYLPSKVYFPSGLEPLIKRARELDIKVGVHLMRGIPRKAYDLDLPVEGTDRTARDIADTRPKVNCTWCKYNYAVDMSKPGAQAWYDGLVRHVADMGVDFIKYDDVTGYPEEIEAIRKAIAKLDRPVMLSLSPGDNARTEYLDSYVGANMLRITGDVWDEGKDLDRCLRAWKKWQPLLAGRDAPDFWLDLDMIPFGNLQVMTPPDETQADVPGRSQVALAGKGVRRQSQLTRPQMRTFITMRALAASPLMMGGDLPTLDDYSLKLLTDPDMLAADQNGVMGHLVSDADDVQVWFTPKKNADGKGWVGVFNRGEKPADLVLDDGKLGLRGDVTLHDVWNDKALKPGAAVTVAGDDVLFIRVD